MIRYTPWVIAAVVVALVTSPLHAAELYWQGGNGTLTDANYTDVVNANVAPTSNDILDFGAGGTATYSVAGPVSFQKLRVGHVQGATLLQGDGTVTINNGAAVSLTVGLSGSANASLWVGNGKNGTLNIDGAGTSVTSAQLIEIGYGNSASLSATVNITNGAALTATAGNINVGDRISSGNGIAGHLNISGTGSALNVSGSGADLNIGVRAGSTYLQSDGAVSIADQVNVGQNAAQNSSFTMSGGTLTAGGAITVGDNTANGSSFTVSGGTLTSASITIGNLANNATGSFSNAIINIPTNNFNVGLGTSQNASVTIAAGADINIPNTASSTGNVFVGRDTSTGATFNMTGGTIDTGRNFLLGNATGATGIVGNQSGGTITTTLNFVVSDTNGASTYNLSGTGAIVSNGLVIVGRQTGTTSSAVMNQTGGSVTAALGVSVANAQSATTSTWGTGTYNVSGGTITANQTTGTALAIAPQGNSGTFRVIGDDATIDVNGNMTVNAGGGAQGTLAYRLETGDLLSMIDVSGTATFAAGASLVLDTSLASPTQSSYNLLTATTITDSGLVFTGPANWAVHIINGGNGQILQAYLPGLTGDYNGDNAVNAADYVTWRSNDGANDAGYVNFRENFNAGPGSVGSLQGAAVPEPASALLALMIAMAWMVARRR
jgi:fibronectin-binding autotransporter adhesin